MHNLAEQGSIVPSVWRGFDELTQEIMQLPGLRQWFATRRSWFRESFQAYLDELALKRSPVAPVIYDDPACVRNPEVDRQ